MQDDFGETSQSAEPASNESRPSATQSFFGARRASNQSWRRSLDDSNASSGSPSIQRQYTALAVDDDSEDDQDTLAPRRVVTSRDPADEACRDSFRRELLASTGSDIETSFRCLDLNRNGELSLQEFTDGITRLNIDWKEATGKKTLKEVFKLFAGRDKTLRQRDIFPEMGRCKMTPPHRMTTPEFWGYWCKSNKKVRKNKKGKPEKRGPKWEAADQEEELQGLFAATNRHQDVTTRKKWMSQTMRRMHKQGKSDGHCREMCATHLPRGTGAMDRDYVHSFSEADVMVCRRTYNDAVSSPIRNIQKQVYAMREQRLELSQWRTELKQVARIDMRKLQRQKAHAQQPSLQRHAGAISLEKFGCLDPEALRNAYDSDDEEEEEEDDDEEEKKKAKAVQNAADSLIQLKTPSRH